MTRNGTRLMRPRACSVDGRARTRWPGRLFFWPLTPRATSLVRCCLLTAGGRRWTEGSNRRCKGVQGSGFRVQGSGFRVQSSEFRVQGWSKLLFLLAVAPAAQVVDVEPRDPKFRI